MVVRVATVAFEGIEARPVDVQVQIANGNVGFHVVGLGDKAVAESRERVRAALIASGLAMPARRVIVNLAPADMPKEGSHYDLPIALAMMAAMGALPSDALAGFTILGELALDGTITAVAGCLPAALAGRKQLGPRQRLIFLRRARSSSSPIISKARKCCRGPCPPSAAMAHLRLIWPKSKDRKMPNARWKLRPPVAIIC
jgi:predicted ATPase with chaperone activity